MNGSISNGIRFLAEFTLNQVNVLEMTILVIFRSGTNYGKNTIMIKVIIAEHSDQVRQYLHSIVDAHKDFEVAGIAKDGAEAVNMVQLKNPDIVVMDIHMPRMGGYEATKRIMEKYPLPIVIMSSDRDPSQIKDTFRALQGGAIAKVKKPEGPFMQDYDLLV